MAAPRPRRKNWKLTSKRYVGRILVASAGPPPVSTRMASMKRKLSMNRRRIAISRKG